MYGSRQLCKRFISSGKEFERKTDYRPKLLEQGFTMMNGFLSKRYSDKVITFVSQHGLKSFLKTRYDQKGIRNPDEAFIIEYYDGKNVIKILEKKEQRVEGSIELKLWSGPSVKREYELVLGEHFQVCYGFCVNDFLKTKIISNNLKYTTLRQILNESDIQVLFGDDSDYFENVNEWIIDN